MELKKFAQEARRQLLEQVAARVEQVLRTDSIEIREKVKAVKQLREEIKASSEAAVVAKEVCKNKIPFLKWSGRIGRQKG